MKSMTDFIMEQEMPSVEEEVFNEAALVSQFMGMQAAAAEMNCIYEYASIATFCESNDIEIPEMLVQEGFRDVMNKIWSGISNFFKKIADWFKSLVKGTVATFSASKLNEIIAKLKTYDLKTEVEDKKIIAPLIIYQYIVAALEGFREFVIHPIAENTVDGSGSKDDKDNQLVAKVFIDHLDGYIEDIKKLKETSNWKSIDGSFVNNFDLPVLKHFINNIDDTGKITSTVLDGIVDKSVKVTYQNVVDTLEKVNRLDIPKTGTKILSELNVDVTKFTKLKNGEKVKVEFKPKDNTSNLAKANNVDETALANEIIVAYGDGTVNKDGEISVDGAVEVTTLPTWVSDPDVQKKVKEASDLLATVYDKAKTGLSDTAAAVFKDLKKADGEEADKTYQHELKGLNADTGRTRLSRNNSIAD